MEVKAGTEAAFSVMSKSLNPENKEITIKATKLKANRTLPYDALI